MRFILRELEFFSSILLATGIIEYSVLILKSVYYEKKF